MIRQSAGDVGIIRRSRRRSCSVELIRHGFVVGEIYAGGRCPSGDRRRRARPCIWGGGDAGRGVDGTVRPTGIPVVPGHRVVSVAVTTCDVFVVVVARRVAVRRVAVRRVAVLFCKRMRGLAGVGG